MKINFIVKSKWWVLAIILILALIAVSISYASWDKLSVNAMLTNNSSGNYQEVYQLVEDNYSADGSQGANGKADVGDIVTFGNYYQQANAKTKSPIRWIIVNDKNNAITLLSEKVIAFGSFWGNHYHNGITGVNATVENGIYYQNYSKSTVRAWLNSYYTGVNARNDAGTAFTINNEQPRFRGFLSEAFTEDEQLFIKPKTISNMQGFAKDDTTNAQYELYDTINDRIWLPSWFEIYGTSETPWGTTIDGNPSSQFDYFSNIDIQVFNERLFARTTAFASTPSISNYTFTDTQHIANAQITSANDIAWWWLRSPSPREYRSSLVIAGLNNVGTGAHTLDSSGGVRPAIVIEK